ncbi:MAG: hypothetical protein D6730_10520 [Bacteroidetes bacterium]|nr:MAG: hypothetical protein D6730_10520 [Bacteroidota bacterium]
MASVEIKTTVTFQDLLKGVEKLELNELEEFLQKVLKLRARKVAPSLSEKETVLLTNINREIPPHLSKRFKELDKKRQDEALSKEEQEELTTVLEQIEGINVERIQALAELAHIRQCTLRELVQQLGIQPT